MEAVLLEREILEPLVAIVGLLLAAFAIRATSKVNLARRRRRPAYDDLNSTDKVWRQFYRFQRRRALHAIAALVHEEELNLSPAQVPTPLHPDDAAFPRDDPTPIRGSTIYVTIDKLLSVLPDKLRHKVMKSGVAIGFPLCVLRQVALRGMKPDKFWPSLPFSLDLQRHVQQVVTPGNRQILRSRVPPNAIRAFSSSIAAVEFLWALPSESPMCAYLVVLHSSTDSHTFAFVNYQQEEGEEKEAWLINSNAGLHCIATQDALHQVLRQDPLITSIFDGGRHTFFVAKIDTSKETKPSFTRTIEW